MSKSRKFDKWDRYIDGPRPKSKKKSKKRGYESVLKVDSRFLSDNVEMGRVYIINSEDGYLSTEKSSKGFVGVNIYNGEECFIPTSEIFTIDSSIGLLNSLVVKVCDDNSIKTRTCIYELEQKGSSYLFDKYNKESDLQLFGEFDTIFHGNVKNLKAIGEDVYNLALDVLEHCIAFDLQVIVE